MFWLLGCEEDSSASDASLRLRWLQSWPDEGPAEARLGLDWALSSLGGLPPADGSALAEEGEVLRLDLEAAGLDPELLAVEADDDLRLFGALDLGRWLMATLFTPEVYYRSTGACPSLDEWAARHPTDADFVATESAIVDGARDIGLRLDPATAAEVAFSARAEGHAELETLDLMPSGQQRFAVYDEDGRLAPASSEAAVGPPGRCMWCHEGRLMPLIVEGEAVEGSLTPAEFSAQVELAQAALDEARAGLSTSVDYAVGTHEWTERLVQGFLAPTADRVAAEWQTDEAEVAQWLAGLPTTVDEEYGDDRLRYARADVDAALEERLAAAGESWTPPPTPASARELDPAEVDWDPGRFACD